MEQRPAQAQAHAVRTTTGVRRRRSSLRWCRSASDALPRAMVVVILVCSGALSAVALAGSAGAIAVPPPGQVTGNVTVAKAPAGFSGIVGVVACPGATTTPVGCSSPQYTISGSGGSYTLALPAGTWQVTGFYEIGDGSGAFFGPSRPITVARRGTIRQKLSIQYQSPSGVVGTAGITGVPSGVSIEELSVTACPASTPIIGGTPSLFCATTYLAPGSGQYSIATLSRGDWLLYVGYYTLFGLTTTTSPTPVSLPRNSTVTVDLSAAYQTPTNALVEGTITVTGAPPGFSGIAGVGACPQVTGPPSVCSDPQYTLTPSGGSYELLLPAGQWEMAGFYELAPFGGQFLNTLQDVTVAGGTIVDLDFTVAYVAPATIIDPVTVTSVPPGVTIEDTTVLACPSTSPYDGVTQPIVCVDSDSPAGTPDTIDTLPPGKWLLYPGYLSSTGQEIGTKATHVTLKSGETRTKKLTIPYGSS
jgi:hypothetical protein